MKRAIARLLDEGHGYRAGVWAFERMFMESALKLTRGNRCAAARILGLHRNTLSRKLDVLGIAKRRQQGNGNKYAVSTNQYDRGQHAIR